MKHFQHENTRRWLHPPTIEQIEAVVKAAGVSERRFEFFHGIYEGCITDVRVEGRNLPKKYWHIFFDNDIKKTPPKLPPKPKYIKKRPKQKPKEDSRLAQLLG